MAGKKRILLIDDSITMLALEKGVLEERGYQVAVASNLLEFRDQLDRFQPQIILTDLIMPDMSGQDIVRILKHDLDEEQIPIIVFSSRPEAELAEVAERSGADGFLSKSSGIERLGDMVDELVDSIAW